MSKRFTITIKNSIYAQKNGYYEVTNNYFLLYHNVEYELSNESLLLNFNDEDFDAIAALILSIKQEKLDYFLELEAFKKLCKQIIINGFLDASTLYEFSYLVINRLTNNLNLIVNYLNTFEYLQTQSLLTEQEKIQLKMIFEPLGAEVQHLDRTQNDFIADKELLLQLVSEVKGLSDSESYIKDLQGVVSYIHNQTFSIGITGVMNVGKSTFINALLSEELLGSSVVAETANLSVIKYAQKPYTKVRFFNKLEFDEMLHTFSDMKERETYLARLQENIEIEKYIQEKSYVKEIERSELHRYTSASDDSHLCHLVKDVELGVNLDFLKDSIEIVDTPGLDDSLIVRESMTQGYVANSDLLIHLMNVNQSATQKDVDFILDCILNQDVTTVLILLTKADNISQKELEEVIEYTKTSIENQLLSLSSDSNVQKVLSSLQFLSISAKTALEVRKLHNDESEHIALQNSGILAVEEYLHTTLFSQNSKNEMIIQNATKKLIDIIQEQIKAYQYTLVLSSKSEDDLEEELRNFNKTKEQNNLTFTQIESDIQSEYESFEKYLAGLNLDMSNEVVQLKERLLNRIVDELSYMLKNKNETPKEPQIKMLIDKTINHGFIDIVREHKHKIEKKVSSVSKDIELSFSSHNITVEEFENSFSMQELFAKNSSSVLSTSAKMILQKTMPLSKSVKLSKIEKFKSEYLQLLDAEFVYVSSHLSATLEELNESIGSSFFEALSLPIEKLKEQLVEHENALEKQIFMLKDKGKDTADVLIDVQDKINKLEAIAKSLS